MVRCILCKNKCIYTFILGKLPFRGFYFAHPNTKIMFTFILYEFRGGWHVLVLFFFVFYFIFVYKYCEYTGILRDLKTFYDFNVERIMFTTLEL